MPWRTTLTCVVTSATPHCQRSNLFPLCVCACVRLCACASVCVCLCVCPNHRTASGHQALLSSPSIRSPMLLLHPAPSTHSVFVFPTFIPTTPRPQGLPAASHLFIDVTGPHLSGIFLQKMRRMSLPSKTGVGKLWPGTLCGPLSVFILITKSYQ